MGYLGENLYTPQTPYDAVVRRKWFDKYARTPMYEEQLRQRKAAADIELKKQRAFEKISGLGGESENGNFELVENIELSLVGVENAAGLTLDLLTKYGQDQGQYDMWMSLSVGKPIPPGYGGGEGAVISYEMLTAQRDNWRLARDRSFVTLVESSNLFYEKIIAFLLALNLYLTESAHPDIELARRYREQAIPLVNAAETVGKIVKSNLQGIFDAYREELRRVDLNLNKLGIPPPNIPKSVNWFVWGLVALGAVVVAQKVL